MAGQVFVTRGTPMGVAEQSGKWIENHGHFHVQEANAWWLLLISPTFYG